MEERKFSSCECWFLDVGQGTSNVILLGEGKAIVIDCGPKSSTQTLDLLHRYVTVIEALVISHNDTDHDGNVQRILNQYRKAINAIYFLKDRTPSSNITTFALLTSAQYREDFPEPKRLEDDKIIFSKDDLKLSVLYPSFTDNLSFEEDPNLTSGILLLKCGNRKIVYPGDAGIKSWESLSQKHHQKPLVCDFMAIPHHGGALSKPNLADHHPKLYTEFIKPERGYISVGSSNRHRHPLPEAIRAMDDGGVEVFCSQMTEQCCKDAELVRQIKRVIPQPSRSSRIADKTKGGKSRNVACFGSLALEVSDNRIKISGLSAFNSAFRSFANISSFAPLCSRVP